MAVAFARSRKKTDETIFDIQPNDSEAESGREFARIEKVESKPRRGRRDETTISNLDNPFIVHDSVGREDIIE